MTVVTGHALHLCHRIMFDFVITDFGFDIRMAVETDLARLTGDEVSLIGAMSAMTHAALPFGKWRMCSLFSTFSNQILVTGHAEFPIVGGLLEKPGLVSAMGRVAARAFPFGEGAMLAEKTFFTPGLTMTGETER